VAIVARSFVFLIVFAAAFLFSYWLLFVQIAPDDSLATGAALLTAAALAWLAWRGMSADAPGVFATTMTWAGTVGAVGFCGGFFGPMIFTPEANQGPLLGLLITGPLGFIGGAAGGLVYSLRRRS
jgi:hypothetical protein